MVKEFESVSVDKDLVHFEAILHKVSGYFRMIGDAKERRLQARLQEQEFYDKKCSAQENNLNEKIVT